MKYHPDKHHRRSIRLNGYDCRQSGAYFVTICTNNHENIFGNVDEGKMELNVAGDMVHKWWNRLSEKYPNIELDEYIIMPNHIHGIIIINGKNIVGVQNIGGYDVGVQDFEPLQSTQSQKNEYQKIIPGSIGSIIRGFKIGVTKWFRHNTNMHKIWQ